MKYFIKYQNPEKHFIKFEVVCNTKGLNVLKLQLPSWRPEGMNWETLQKILKISVFLQKKIICYNFLKALKIYGLLIAKSMIEFM